MTSMRHEKAAHWNPEASASFWINRVSKSLLRFQDQHLRPFGFAMAQMPVLRALAAGGARSQKDLASRAAVEQPTMAALLKRMERDGVIERRLDPQDGRVSLSSLTRQARVRLPKGRAALLSAEQAAMAGFTTDEQALLRHFLRRVVNNIVATESEVERADDTFATPRRRRRPRSSGTS